MLLTLWQACFSQGSIAELNQEQKQLIHRNLPEGTAGYGLACTCNKTQQIIWDIRLPFKKLSGNKLLKEKQKDLSFCKFEYVKC